MRFIKKYLLSALLAPLFGGAAAHGAEFEVLDRLSVNGYTVFRGSADIPGGSLAVGGSTFVVKGGYVGIGTDSPGSLLNLYSAGANPILKITDASGAGTRGALLSGSWGGNGAYLDSLASAGWVYLGSSPGGGQANQVVAYTAGAERLRIASSGSVGIGTIAPNARLSVRQDVSSSSNTVMTLENRNDTGGGNDGSRLAFVSGSGGHQASIQGTHYSGGSTYLAFRTNNTTNGLVDTERMRIDKDGNVGIGTTSPAANLDVGGTGSIKIPVGTTGERPSTPANGMLRLNTTTGKLEYYNNGGWNSIGGVTATGGNSITESGGYRVHTYTSDGTFTVTGSGGNIEVLAVAGGGSGGGAGGGGGGGVIYNTAYTVTSGQAITVTVGAGGATKSGNGVGNNGANSVFGSLTAICGGGGGSYSSGSGAAGGSGGGGGACNAGVITPGSGTSGQGNSGGTGSASCNPYTSGGGGGAGAAGDSVSTNKSGNGGIGRQVNIDGNNYYYGGGGGGGSQSAGQVAGNGGLGGGGGGANWNGGSYGTGGGSARNTGGNGTANGTTAPCDGGAGGANTGGGGGGMGVSVFNGGAGGSGIVIVRYQN